MNPASAEHPMSRRQASAGRAGWSLSQPRMFAPHPVPANDQSDPRNELDELDDRIGAKYDSIAALMHERNARPEDIVYTGIACAGNSGLLARSVYSTRRISRSTVSMFLDPRRPGSSTSSHRAMIRITSTSTRTACMLVVIAIGRGPPGRCRMRTETSCSIRPPAPGRRTSTLATISWFQKQVTVNIQESVTS